MWINKYDFIKLGVDSYRAGNLISNRVNNPEIRNKLKSVLIPSKTRHSDKIVDCYKLITFIDLDDTIAYYEKCFEKGLNKNNHKRMMPVYLDYLKLKESLDD